MWWQEVLHWLWIHTGTGNEPGSYYGFFSGFGSDLQEFTIISVLTAGIVAFYRKHNCEVTGCRRLGRHNTAAGHIVCRKHHPDGKLTHQDVVEAHNDAVRKC
jgi:hypothetical protein